MVAILIDKGVFYLLDKQGNPIPSSKEENFPFKLNPNRISEEAYMIPMIITTYNEDLGNRLNGFYPIKKLFKIKGNEEISVYLDKNLGAFRQFCVIDFEEPVIRLANKLFKDFINFEIDPRLL